MVDLDCQAEGRYQVIVGSHSESSVAVIGVFVDSDLVVKQLLRQS